MQNTTCYTNNASARQSRRRPQKKITPKRLKNIGLFYLQRFETSVKNLREVLQRRVNAYARENPDYNKKEAYLWVEDVLNEFIGLHYLDDNRYAEMKVRDYLSAGKPARYIQNKLREKGISADTAEAVLAAQEYDQTAMALKLAKRKKIGPYRADEQLRKEFRQKDMGTLIRAGFDYDVVCEVLNLDEMQLPDF